MVFTSIRHFKHWLINFIFKSYQYFVYQTWYC
jgi:hypothetical protein